MDIWLKPDNQNRQNFIKTIKEHRIIEDDISEIESMDFEKVHAFYIGQKPNRMIFSHIFHG